MTDMSSWRLKQSSSRAFFSLLPGCHSFSSELARVGKLGKSLKIYGKFRGNPHGGLECLDIDGDITLHRMFRMFRYLRLRMFGKFRNHWVFFSQALELSWSIAKSPQLPKTETFFQSHLVEPPEIAQDGDPNVAGEPISKNHLLTAG